MSSTNEGIWKKDLPLGQLTAQGQCHRPAVRRHREAQASVTGGGEVGDRDRRPFVQPLGRDTPTHDQRAVRFLGHQSVEQDVVRLCHSPPWGEDPCPADGWFPIQGVLVEGAVELSHQEYGPLWLLSIMNS